MKPQELMDLPFAGMAQNQLKLDGNWRHLLTDTEIIDFLAKNVSSMVRDTNKQSWSFDLDREEYYYDTDFFREDIDNAAANMEAQQ